MKRRRLRKWVIPTMILLSITSIMLFQSLNNNRNLKEEHNFVTNALIKNIKQVMETRDSTVIKPFDDESVTISKYYYSKDDDAEKQQNSLIFYENIYLQNTGILYSSDKQFDIVSIIDGTVKNIKEDELLGNTIEIENDNILVVYKSIDNLTVSVGDKVEKGNIISTSGNNKLSNEKDNCLHLEVYKDNKLINPEKIYDRDINEINEK